MVTIPVWAIHHSKSAGYDDPTEYNPDRFIGYKKLASELAGTSEWENRGDTILKRCLKKIG